jgi:hypothetical protein
MNCDKRLLFRASLIELRALPNWNVGIFGNWNQGLSDNELVSIEDYSDKKGSPQCRKASLYKTDLSKFSKYLPQRGHHPLSSIHEFSV